MIERREASAGPFIVGDGEMRIVAVIVGMIVALAGYTAQAQVADGEAAIRAHVANFDAGQPVPQTADRIFWSGAYKRPTVGSERDEEIPTERQPAARVEGSQRNRTTIRRIEVARSGDLAYELSDSVLSFQLRTGAREEFTTSVLRVWKKEGADWKVTAQFARPHFQNTR